MRVLVIATLGALCFAAASASLISQFDYVGEVGSTSECFIDVTNTLTINITEASRDEFEIILPNDGEEGMVYEDFKASADNPHAVDTVEVAYGDKEAVVTITLEAAADLGETVVLTVSFRRLIYWDPDEEFDSYSYPEDIKFFVIDDGSYDDIFNNDPELFNVVTVELTLPKGAATEPEAASSTDGNPDNGPVTYYWTDLAETGEYSVEVAVDPPLCDVQVSGSAIGLLLGLFICYLPCYCICALVALGVYYHNQQQARRRAAGGGPTTARNSPPSVLTHGQRSSAAASAGPARQSPPSVLTHGPKASFSHSSSASVTYSSSSSSDADVPPTYYAPPSYADEKKGAETPLVPYGAPSSGPPAAQPPPSLL